MTVTCYLCGKPLSSGQVTCGLAIKTPFGVAHKICHDFDIKQYMNEKQGIPGVQPWKPIDYNALPPSHIGRLKRNKFYKKTGRYKDEID